MIYALEKLTTKGNEQQEYEKSSPKMAKMAEMARDYHEELQNQDMHTHLDTHDEIIKDLLKDITVTPSPEIIENLKAVLTREQVETH